MHKKFTVTITDDTEEWNAILKVSQVISDGLVSNNNTQYCYVTVFSNGIHVYADRTKSGIHTFRVCTKK